MLKPGAERLLTGMLMLAAILIAWSQTAHSTLKIIEDAVEAPASDVTLPRWSYGLVVVRGCDGCPPNLYRVDENTVYLLGRQRVTLRDLRESLDESRYRDDGLFVVFTATGTDRVTRLRLTAPPRGEADD